MLHKQELELNCLNREKHTEWMEHRCDFSLASNRTPVYFWCEHSKWCVLTGPFALGSRHMSICLEPYLQKPILILVVVWEYKSPFWIAIVCHQMEHNETVVETDKPYLDNGVRSSSRSSPGRHKLPSPKSSHQGHRRHTRRQNKELVEATNKNLRQVTKNRGGGHWLKQWRCNQSSG